MVVQGLIFDKNKAGLLLVCKSVDAMSNTRVLDYLLRNTNTFSKESKYLSVLAMALSS